MSRKSVDNPLFDDSVNGGVPRYRVLEILLNAKWVERAVKSGRCFVCKATDIDQTGLCLICRSFLSDEERAATEPYYQAV